ncbi:transposase [Streptomyces sp. CMB-StM0423]|uniref:transposase n=1 Tax=Streptomyces sp. CMB-StM0423 TaxID=2059884 RepID=UPI001F340D18|nr:transposase [Streptomyces sp. CMB-StM0423]
MQHWATAPPSSTNYSPHKTPSTPPVSHRSWNPNRGAGQDVTRSCIRPEFHDRLCSRVRESQGREREPTAAIVDSQSVKAAASVPARSRGFDGAKNINGRKRHLIVDCLGLLLMVLVTPADVTDRDAACGMLPRLLARHRKIRLVWADGGYTGRLVDWARNKLRLTLEIVKRSDNTRGFVVLPRRWCVERTLAWLMRSRRLTRDYETRPATSEAVVHWSMAILMGRRLARRRT